MGAEKWCPAWETKSQGSNSILYVDNWGWQPCGSCHRGPPCGGSYVHTCLGKWMSVCLSVWDRMGGVITAFSVWRLSGRFETLRVSQHFLCLQTTDVCQSSAVWKTLIESCFPLAPSQTFLPQWKRNITASKMSRMLELYKNRHFHAFCIQHSANKVRPSK